MFNPEQRKPIWLALSQFYLDTELDDSDMRQIASTFLDSPYTLHEIKTINKYEVFPILQQNVLSVAGEWVGFEENLLCDTITRRLKQKTKLNDLGVDIYFFLFKWMHAKYWMQLTTIYNDLKANRDKILQ